MNIRTRVRSAATITAAAGTAVAGLVVAPAAHAGALPAPATINVTVTNSAITFTGGAVRHAGRVVFVVNSVGGEHTLQLVKLIGRTTPQQVERDGNAALGQGDVAAVRRLNSEAHFLGGVDVPEGGSGAFAETLYAGTYYLTDASGPSTAMATLRVYGTPSPTRWIANNSTVGMHNYGFSMPSVLPHAGWMLLSNTADEPHFVFMQRVLPNVTDAMVKAALAAPNPPDWALETGAGSGILSPATQQLFHYSLPPGKYLVACWYPDDDTGMPHALMGMWRLVTLR